MLLAVAPLTLLAGSPAPATAQGEPAASPPAATGESCPLPPKADAPLRDFKPVDDLFLEVDGKRVTAEIYRSDSAGAVLVISSALSSPVVLRATSLVTVALAGIEKKSDGVMNIKPDAVLKPQGAFEITSDAGASFTAGGRQATLRPPVPLLGLRRADEVTAHNPEYAARARKYAPDAKVLDRLRKEPRAVTVRIFYGSWCSHCAALVPSALKVEQELRPSKIRFEYFGVSRRFHTDPELKKVDIKKIPTAVVYVGGQEVGRILDDKSWETPESALRAILEGKVGAGR
jgi:thiol-disulfide isomerase/thioredoxin